MYQNLHGTVCSDDIYVQNKKKLDRLLKISDTLKLLIIEKWVAIQF